MQAPYFLQPRNATQAASSNWYNITYRGTGRYKGFGQQDAVPVEQVGAGGVVDPYAGASGAPIPIGTIAMVPDPQNPGQYLPAATSGTAAPGAAPAALANFMPWIIGGLLIFLIAEGWGKK